MGREVLIVGGSGFIALNIIRRFLDEGFNIYVYGRNPPSVFFNEVNFIQGELFDISVNLSELVTSFRGEVIYLVNNVPVNSDVDNYYLLLSENKRAIDFIFTFSARLVFFSSGGRIYDGGNYPHSELDDLKPICLYGRSKLELENHIRNEGKKKRRKYLIVRPSNPYGKYQRTQAEQGLIAVTIGKIMRGESISIWGDGGEIRDYIYIDDFVDLFYALFTKSDIMFDTYNISSGCGVSTINVVTIIASAFKNHNVEINHVLTGRDSIKCNILSNVRLMNEIGPVRLTPLAVGIERFIGLILAS